METPDFEMVATSLYDAMGRGSETDVRCIKAALHLVHVQALESAARVAEQRKPTNPRDDWTEYAMIVNAEVEKTAAAIRALATKEDGNG